MSACEATPWSNVAAIGLVAAFFAFLLYLAFKSGQTK